jgi:hypothetical protein
MGSTDIRYLLYFTEVAVLKQQPKIRARQRRGTVTDQNTRAVGKQPVYSRNHLLFGGFIHR